MSVTIPTYDWNLLVAASTNDIVYDNISSNTATYESGLTGSATLGTVNNSNSGRLRIPSSSVSFHFNFSMEFVVRINSALGYHQVFFSHSNDGKYGFGLYYGNSTSNQLRFFGSLATVYSLFQSDTTGTYTGSALSTDGSTYYHIVCVLDGANDSAYMYQDGTKIWEQTSIGLSESDFPITPSTYVCLGKEQQATNINVKTFRIWETHALSAAEVTTLYNNRNTANYISTIITPTLPTHNWNFRQTVSAGGTISDNINGTTATYNNGLTSDPTKGLDLSDDNGEGDNNKFASLAPFNTGTEFSMEFYFQKTPQTSANSWPYLIAITNTNSSLTSTDNFFHLSWDSENEPHDIYSRLNGTAGTSDTILIDDANVYAHFVVTFNDTTKELKQYLNGSLVLTDTLNNSLTDTTYTYNYIGATPHNTNKQFNCYLYYFRYWKNGILSGAEIQSLYTTRNTNLFSFTNLRINYGDVYLVQTLNKTLNDYITENIPLNDVSFAAFPINKFKETYILGDVDISGDTILRSNTTYFTDISADTFDVSGNLLISDLSANNRLFVGDDVSFNSNVTIQGDLSFGGDISFNGTFTRALAGIGTGSGLLMNTDFSMNANLEFNGATTVKNDLHFNAYSDVSANPVLTDGTLLHNQKMEKLDHRYLLDISRSSPFSTLNYHTLPSNIYDNSTNSGICISGDGKYIRTVNSSDVSANALSYYSEDYGSSFQEDKDLSTKLSICDISINTATNYNDYYSIVTVPATTITDAPTFNNFLTGGATYTQTFNVDGITYTCSLSQSTLGSNFDIWRAFKSSTGVSSDTCCTSRTNNYYQNSSYGNYTNNTISYTDFNGNSATQNAQWMIVDINDGNGGYYKVTRVQVNSVYVNNYITEWMIFGRNESGNTVQLSNAVSGGWGSLRTITITDQTLVNQIYIAGTKGRTHNSFVSFHNIEFDLEKPETRTPITSFKYGSDKIFMSYNGQHQLVPRGISNNQTFDDFLYVSNNFGKNWNLRKNNTISTTTYAYTVTANGSSNYILNGGGFSSTAQPAVYIYLNESTEFTIDSTTNGNHPFKIGTSENGGEITDSRITSVTSGSNQVVTFKPTTSGTFYYYCSAHSGMGSSINVIEPAGRFSLDASGSTWFWNTGAVSADGKHMYVSGKTGLWKSQDFGTSWYQASADSSFNYMSISADGKQVYGVNERKVYGSSDYGNTVSTLYTDSSTTDLNYAGISTSGNGKYLTIADVSGYNIYMSSNYGNSFELTPLETEYVEVSGIPTATYDWDFRVATPSNNIVKDSIGGLNATYVSGVTSSVSAGAYFSGGTSDGNSPYINLDAFAFGGGYSFEAYVKFNSTDNYARILDFGALSGTGTNNLLLARLGTSTSFYWGINSGTPFSNGTISNGVLTHIVAIISTSGAQTLYQDGALVNETGSTTKTSVSTRSNYYLGRSNWSTDAALEGNIQFLRVYNSELSSSDVTKLYEARAPVAFVNNNINCGMSHSGKIVLNSNYISYNYGNNFYFVPDLISNQLTNNDTFYSKANMEYLLDPSNNLMLSIPYKSAQFQDIYSVGSIKVGTTTYSSDYRIKENVEELGEQDTLNELRPVKYYNTNLERNDYGLIAHELQEKYPFLVSGEKDGPEPQSINYNGLISLLVHDIKNLKKEYLELKEMKK